MSSLLRTCCCAALGLVLLAGVGYGSVCLTSGAGGLRDALRALAAESRRDREMTVKEDAIQQVLRIKSRITLAVIGGKMSLAQAVAAFRAAYEANPASLPEKGLDDERLAANALNWVRSELQARSTPEESVLRRLEAELRELYDRPNSTPAPAADLTQ